MRSHKFIRISIILFIWCIISLQVLLAVEPVIHLSESSKGEFIIANRSSEMIKKVSVMVYPPAIASGTALLIAYAFSVDVPAIRPGKAVILKREAFSNGYGAELPAEQVIGVVHIVGVIKDKRQAYIFIKQNAKWEYDNTEHKWYAIPDPILGKVAIPWKQKLNVEFYGSCPHKVNNINEITGLLINNNELADIIDLLLTICPEEFQGGATFKDKLYSIKVNKLSRGEFILVELSDLKNHWGDSVPGPCWGDCKAKYVMASGKVDGELKGTIIIFNSVKK